MTTCPNGHPNQLRFYLWAYVNQDEIVMQSQHGGPSVLDGVPDSPKVYKTTIWNTTCTSVTKYEIVIMPRTPTPTRKEQPRILLGLKRELCPSRPPPGGLPHRQLRRCNDHVNPGTRARVHWDTGLTRGSADLGGTPARSSIFQDTLIWQ